MGDFDMLLSPLEVTPNFKLRNRIVKSPQSTWRWNEDGTADGSAGIDLYEAIAKGGAAAVNIAGINWEPAPWGIYLYAYDDKFIPGLKELNDRVHAHGCLTIGQLHHGGPLSPAQGSDRPICSSTLEEDELPTIPPEGMATRG